MDDSMAEMGWMWLYIVTDPISDVLNTQLLDDKVGWTSERKYNTSKKG